MEFVDRIKKGAGRSGMVVNPDKIVRMQVAADMK
jgi:peptidylprolyl isomerase